MTEEYTGYDEVDLARREMQEEVARLRADSFDLALQNVLATSSGREVLWELMSRAGVYHDTFDPDPYQHAHNAGVRNQGLLVLTKVFTIAPEKFTIMQRESKERETRFEVLLERGMEETGNDG